MLLSTNWHFLCFTLYSILFISGVVYLTIYELCNQVHKRIIAIIVKIYTMGSLETESWGLL